MRNLPFWLIFALLLFGSPLQAGERALPELTISAGPLVTPGLVRIGQPVTFTITTSGQAPFTYHWNFGLDLSLSDTGTTDNPTVHTYQSAGGYNGDVVVTDATGASVVGNFTVIVTDPATDVAGNGVPDQLKTDLGISSNANVQVGLQAFCFELKFKSAKIGADSLSSSDTEFFVPGVSGTLPQLGGQKLGIQIANIDRVFTITQSGKKLSATPINPAGKDKMKVRFISGGRGGVRLSFKFVGGITQQLAAFLGVTIPNSEFHVLPLYIVLGNQLFADRLFIDLATGSGGDQLGPRR